jgi:hypothetical protein
MNSLNCESNGSPKVDRISKGIDNVGFVNEDLCNG